MSGLPVILSFTGIGILIGCFIAVFALSISLIATYPWLPIVILGLLFGFGGAIVEAAKDGRKPE